MKIALINHGCPKNLVDSELMLGLLAQKGHDITLEPESSDIVIINTCSFIHDAEKESVQSILEMAQDGKKIIVTGCLAQKYKDELKEAMPEINAMIGPSDINQIVDIVEAIENENAEKYISKISEKPEYIYPETVERQQITMGASSYIKIADGCNYHCGYCIIPQLRGEYHSRPIEKIVEEAKKMADKGVTEIILIAQDTTSYGIDLYGKQMLPKLLSELNKIENISWIRFMYAYPSQVSDELLDTMAKLDKVVKYIDLPLQHYDKDVLKSMRRPDFDYVDLIKNIRAKVPNVAIRTAFIVGYPGETEEQFNKLYDFVKNIKFDRMGVFEYSREKNTVSYDMKDQIPEKVKKARYNKLMALQQGISTEINKKYIGKTIPCIVEGFTDDGVVIMRSEHDAPEIDGLVYATCENSVVPGDIENVKIEKSDEYDLFGKIV
ncbi:MAG: 30S ribosomal protein S12 methylthiotransferase RimO [Clostridiaceae bacterium]|jgi:ribosomal protein S12 methylthiotransferase|nr:30S ribosomal protein S12 methylthiotransferase RimO [Clostridiaceae bacterium]